MITRRILKVPIKCNHFFLQSFISMYVVCRIVYSRNTNNFVGFKFVPGDRYTLRVMQRTSAICTSIWRGWKNFQVTHNKLKFFHTKSSEFKQTILSELFSQEQHYIEQISILLPITLQILINSIEDILSFCLVCRTC